MDGPVFDAMLKTALEEALRRDLEEAPEVPAPSWRQRRRMRKLLADPWSAGSPSAEAAPERRRGRPVRWLAVVVIAALLTGAAAAGFALGSGERFRRMFEESGWAEDYGAAADTEQLLDLGAEMDTVLVESGGLRFEMLDAIFDGQMAMVELRVTILDPSALERLRGALPHFDSTELLWEDGRAVSSYGYSISSPEDTDLEEGQYSVVLTINDGALSAGGQCRVRLKDLILLNEDGAETLLTGEWTLSVTLPPTEVLRLEPERVCRAAGADWMLDSVTLSPLALQLCFHLLSGEERRNQWYPYKDLTIHLKDGEIIGMRGCTTSVAAGGARVDVSLEFPVPLDLERIDHIHVCGEDVYLEE